MKFDYSAEINQPDPAYQNKSYGDKLPILKAKGNLTYPQLIRLIGMLWADLNPEIDLVPYGGFQQYNPERGYIVYGLDNRKPAADNAKTRFREEILDPTNPDKKFLVFSQTFDNLISFTAIHKNPYVAEELIEAFEDFMIEIQPFLIREGVQNVNYARRTHDENKSRYGEDVAARVIIYMMQLQKILIAEVSTLNEISIRAQAYVQLILDDTNQATPNIKVHIYDNYATPNT